MVDVAPWTPLGRALLDHLEDRVEPPGLEVILEDGERQPCRVEEFFFDADHLTRAEFFALVNCRGRVLDVGAGTGRHALELQANGSDVTALDICPQAVEVMRRRGLRQVLLGDVFTLNGGDGTYDTVLLLMNGIGVVGDLDGLDRFLDHVRGLLRDGGRVLFDSWDPSRADAAAAVARAEERVRRGRYPGETLQRLAYRGEAGGWFPWLYVDSETLAEHAARHGFHSHVAFADSDGSYLGRLAPA